MYIFFTFEIEVNGCNVITKFLLLVTTDYDKNWL